MLADLRTQKELNAELKIPSIWELVQIVVNRKEWRSKTPYRKWSYFYAIGRVCLSPFGVTLYEVDQTIRLRGYFYMVAFLAFMLTSINTTYYYINNGEFSKGLPPTCLLSILLSVCFVSASAQELNSD